MKFITAPFGGGFATTLGGSVDYIGERRSDYTMRMPLVAFILRPELSLR